jgi:hypothetical protein
VLAQEAAAPAGATDAEALEEEVAAPPPAPLPPPRPVSPTGRLGFASFGSFDDPARGFESSRAVEPTPIAPSDADRAVAAVGPVEVPPLTAALDAPDAEVTPTAASESSTDESAVEADVPTAAPARPRSRAPGRGRRARGQADADTVASTEGTPP